MGARLLPLCLSLLAAVPSAEAGRPGTERDEPLTLGLEERVDVQFALVDFLVLDRRGRTVPGLRRDDFYLIVDGKEIALASLDIDCLAGAAEDPAGGGRRAQLAPTREPRQIVLVFDYDHMTNLAETFERALEMLDRFGEGGERHMVVSLGQVVRIEAPFTSDLNEVRRTLRRMRDDPGLYAGNHGRLTEHRFFERIGMLFDLLEPLPGRKTLVLLSGPFTPDGFFHDPQYRELSARSTVARTAVYPVDTGGLRTLDDPWNSPLGGPIELRRLANETGGRMTADTNDIGLAYARAHRDLGCTYTLGFTDARPRLDRQRRLTLEVKDRTGLRLVYPEFYVVRSRKAKRESLLRTAVMTPEMFESDELSAELSVLGPASRGRWRVRLSVEIRPRPGTLVGTGETWKLKGLLRKPNGTLVRAFDREVPIPSPGAGSDVVTVHHEFSARAGRYVASAVLSGGRDQPRSTSRVVEIVARGQSTFGDRHP